ncbi:hypothetical protein [Nocardia crassostreae]|uniref:hypothetical protein n=1 Tax=Nocardia crassostreae TaxID=53428 RepID=UPI00082A5AD2|nr:hypothetical protein [Nocardia crassostreae]
MNARVAAAAVTTLVALLTGCSSGSEHQNHPETTPATTTSTATTTTAPPTSTTVSIDGGEAADPTEYRQDESIAGAKGYFFQTPSGNIHCAIFDKPVSNGVGTIDIGCQGKLAAIPAGEQACVKPEHSQAPMPAFSIGQSGAGFSCEVSPLFYGRADSPALPYGSSLQIGGYKCVSREVGISCGHVESGDSFFVSKESSRVVNSAGVAPRGIPPTTTR